MSSSLLILHLEDDPYDAELVADKLRRTGLPYELRVVRDAAEYAAALSAERFDLILSDYGLPSYDGMSALALARAQQPEVPFILISGALGEEQAVDCVLHGATDYVLKQRLDRLLPAVQRALTEAEERRKRREAEEALHIRNHALATSLSAMAMADLQGRMTYVNQAFLDLWGYAGDHEVLGRSYLEFLADQERDTGTALFDSALQIGRWTGELSMRRADGSAFVAVALASVVTNTAGAAVGFLASFFDLSVRVQAEQALRQAKELAEAANLAKSQFLHNMSHEFRTPLTAILGFSELLLNPGLSPRDQQTFRDAIRAGGAALVKLIDDILHLSRLEAERLTVQRVACSLPKLLADVTFGALAQAQQKGLQLHVSEPSHLPEIIRTDPLCLSQILQNLLDNAVKFTDRGEIRLMLRAEEKGDGARLQFVVSDTGIGIPASQLGRVFQPFVQSDGSLTRRFGGTGLGLAICSRLADALQGELTVTSEPGQGSTFVLTIPVGPAGPMSVPQPQASELRPEPVSQLAPATLSGRVLIAEDDPTLQLLLYHQLQQVGLQPVLAAHGRQACELVEQSQALGCPYDLIFLDMQMPLMDGYDVARWLRRGGWPGPIVAVTVHALTGDRERCLAAGCDDHLPKPIVLTQLRKILVRYLGAPRTQQSNGVGVERPGA